MKQPFVQFGTLSVLLGLGTASIWYLSGSGPGGETPVAQLAEDAVPRSPMFASGPIAAGETRTRGENPVAAAHRNSELIPAEPSRPVALPLVASDTADVLPASVSTSESDNEASAAVSLATSAVDPEPAVAVATPDPLERDANQEFAALSATLEGGHAIPTEPQLARGQEPRQLQSNLVGGNPLRAAIGEPTPAAPLDRPGNPIPTGNAGDRTGNPLMVGRQGGLVAPRELQSPPDSFATPRPSAAVSAPRPGWSGAPTPVEARGSNPAPPRQAIASPAPIGSGPTAAPRAYPPAPREASVTPRAALVSPPSRGRGGGGSTIEGGGRPGEVALEGPQAPQLVVEKFAPAEIQVGKQAIFEIVVRNTGQQVATDVLIVDVVPEGTQLVATTPRADQVDRGEVVWEVGQLPPGEERVFEIQLLPLTEGDLGSVARVHFSAEASVRTRCTKPEIELTATAARKVMIGEDQVINMQLYNPGSGDATGVILLANVPEGMSHAHGPSLELEIGTLRAGETRQLELVLHAEQPGLIQSQLVARGDANIVAESVAEFEVVAPAIQVAVDGPRRRYLDRPATYTLAIRNPGTATAREIELVSHLPEGMEFIRANNMGEYDEVTHSVHWSLAELPPNEDAPVELVMLPVSAGTQTIEVESRADLGISDRTAQEIEVEGIAAIKFEVVDVADPIEVGGETTYEISVVNQGSSVATNVLVQAALPPGMSIVGAAGPTRHELRQNQVLFAPLDKLSPKADVTYRVDVQGVAAGDQRFRVQILTDQVQQPITKEESTHVYTDQ